MAATSSADALYTMTLLPEQPALEPFDRRDLIDFDEPALPRPRPRDDGPPPPEEDMVSEIRTLRHKFDDALAFGLNVLTEKRELANEVVKTKREAEAARAKASPSGDDGVDAFEKAFEETEAATGFNVVQIVVVVVVCFCLGYASHCLPGYVMDFLDARDDGAAPGDGAASGTTFGADVPEELREGLGAVINEALQELNN